MLADLDSLQIDSRPPRIVPLSTKGEGSPLLFVHDVTGTVDVYHRVVEQLNPDRPCYGIHAPAYTAAADAGLTIEAMASSYLKASRALLTAGGKAVLAGFSLGGMIAYEMARQHAETGGRELPVLMVDITVSLPRSRLELTRDMMLNLPAWLRHDGLKTSPWALVQRGLRRVHKAFAPNAQLPSSGIWAELLGRPVAHPEVTQVMLAALQKYVPPPYSGPVVLLRGKDRHLFNTRDPALGWSAYAQNLRTDALPGSHDTWILDEKLPASVEVMRRNLDSFD
jgi:thioesterase domain-containing protein